MTARPALLRAALIGVAVFVAAGALWAVLQALAATTRVERVGLDAGAAAVRLEVDQGDIGVRAEGERIDAVARERSFLVGVARESEVRDGAARLRWRCRFWTSCRVNVTARSPQGAALEAVTGFGDVRVAGPTGDLTVRTRAGAIEGRALTAGRVLVESGRGDVTLAFATAPRDVEVDVSSGDVEVRVPAGAYRIDATTRSGDVRIAGLRPDPAATRSITVETTAGDVVVGTIP